MPTNNLTPRPTFPATAARDAPPPYDRVAIALHWLLAALIVAMLALGCYMGSLPKGPERAGLFNLHKSVGTVVLLLVAFRLLWRAGHRPPGWNTGVSALRHRFAAGGHFLL